LFLALDLKLNDKVNPTPYAWQAGVVLDVRCLQSAGGGFISFFYPSNWPPTRGG